MIRILIAGEGPNELGGWYVERPYRDEPYPGVIETLLRRVRADGWEIVDGVAWRSIRKFRPNQPGKAEMRNLWGAMLITKEKRCDALAFTRDRDGKKNQARESDIQQCMAELRKENPDGPAIIGGMAIEKLESWLVALTGKTGTEKMRRPQEVLEKMGVSEKGTEAMVRLVERANVERIPKDAYSLRQWLGLARSVLDSQDVKNRA